MKNAELLCGAKGVEREVKRVSVIECPESPELFKEGDFFITAFFAIRDDLNAQYNMVAELINARAAGLCIINQYFNDLAESIKIFADDNMFPIFLLPNEIPYSDIILDIVTYILEEKDESIKGFLIDEILESNGMVKNEKIALKLNPYFLTRNICMYVIDKNGKIADYKAFTTEYMYAEEKDCIAKYKNGILLIKTYSDLVEDEQIYNEVKKIIKQFGKIDSIYVGISTINNNIGAMNNGIIEAMKAAGVAMSFKEHLMYYKDLGIYGLLTSLKENLQFQKYCDDVTKIIRSYDESYNTNLFGTCQSFANNDGNINKTAKELFVHPNTVRYRIEKAKQILSIKSDVIFHEIISLVFQYNRIRNL